MKLLELSAGQDGRIPPQAVDVEEQVLGAMLLEKDAITAATSVLDAEAFYSERNRKVFEAISALFRRGDPADCITVGQELRKTGELDLVGGQAYLIELTMKVTSGANAEYHARIVLEKYLLRRLITTSGAIASRAFSQAEDTAELLQDAERQILSITRDTRENQVVPMSAVAEEANDMMDRIHAGQGSGSILSGFADIDRLTGGFDPGDLVILAGLEKSGKSTLMIQWVFHNAIKGTPCLIFSAEMRRVQILYRYAMLVENISWVRFKLNQLSDDEWSRLGKRVAVIGTYPIFIRHGMMSISDVIADSARTTKDEGIKLIATDYIQKIVPAISKNDTREREVAAISSGLKDIAGECGVPVIALSQLSEEMRARESRAIEQDMDKMVTINKDESWDKRPGNELTPDGRGKIVKIKLRQRLGRSGDFGDIKLYYDLETGSWRSIETHHELPQMRERADIF